MGFCHPGNTLDRYCSLVFVCVLQVQSPHDLSSTKGQQTGERTIQMKYLVSMPLLTPWPAIRQRHYATAVSSVAVVQITLLTKVAFALYSAKTVNQRTAVEVERLDSFHDSQPIKSSDNSAAHAVQFITEKSC